jgi:hypothetical protein
MSRAIEPTQLWCGFYLTTRCLQSQPLNWHCAKFARASGRSSPAPASCASIEIRQVKDLDMAAILIDDGGRSDGEMISRRKIRTHRSPRLCVRSRIIVGERTVTSRAFLFFWRRTRIELRASNLFREGAATRLGLSLRHLVGRHLGLRQVFICLRLLMFLISFLSLRHGILSVISYECQS